MVIKNNTPRPGEKEKIKEKLDVLREKDKDFDKLVSEIEARIEEFISGARVEEKSYRPKYKSLYLKVFVKAIPITYKELVMLEKYLNVFYLRHFSGDAIHVKKCIFSHRYVIKSKTDYSCNDY